MLLALRSLAIAAAFGCAGGINLLADNADSTQAACTQAQRASQEDHWYFVTYEVDESGVHDLKIPFASEKSFAETLLSCAASDWFPRNAPQPMQGIPILRADFSYMPSVGSRDVEGRLIRPRFPAYPGLSGDLALRVEMSPEGKMLAKNLLFSTDDQLGQQVLEDLEQALQVENPGKGSGPMIDILLLKFQNGELAIFGQSHHSKPKE